MQLSRLYSNLPDVFEPIDFNCCRDADTLNVIFAKVKKPKDRDKDSHNLGKTTLIHLLDFCLLKGVPDTRKHFLAVNRDRFAKFTFFLEIALSSGGFVTVRRSVLEHTRVAFKRHTDGKCDLTQLPDDEWEHSETDLSSAVKLLDSYLNLTAISPWGYRKGFSYFLRTQKDYVDVFQIQKFVQGKDRDWKPYLAKVFGLNHQAAYKKYEIDQELNDLKRLAAKKQGEISPEHKDRNDLHTHIEILRDELREVEARLDSFDFSQEEGRINKRIVNEIEKQATEALNGLYNLKADISQIENAISTGFSFSVDHVAQIFEESKVLIPEGLKREYAELVDFNKKLTRERNAALKTRKRELEAERDELETLHDELNERRQNQLKIVREADTFKKYKVLQKQFSKQRSDLTYLVGQLKRLDEVAELEEKIRLLGQDRDQLVADIGVSLRKEDATKNEVIRLFNRYVKRVLDINGEFVVAQNKEGNLDFKIRTKDATGRNTSQADGKTYGHLICALFDLAVLKALEDANFFHFVYHDGLLEALDDRKKILLLELIREVISDGKIQYILSAIDADLPRNEDDEKMEFSDNEVVLSLHDDGIDGQLFKMPPF